ncbi:MULTISPECIES: hypothetical protein [unclassified Nostoc]|uniref:Uncharacterized protein n=1 Tax=Nostoc punctiforme NIES-2108 TaxID=1356359 RepID=A0A367RBY8_NOSPU|nr:hypothetical protein [Nostoc sp. JL31]MBN3888807.1 hypothetical protein [Nostoc sp. JL31]RCJ34037.1 hypothetical protein A6769_23695 [Nostoc punctiforme NIES-2108]
MAGGSSSVGDSTATDLGPLNSHTLQEADAANLKLFSRQIKFIATTWAFFQVISFVVAWQA